MLKNTFLNDKNYKMENAKKVDISTKIRHYFLFSK